MPNQPQQIVIAGAGPAGLTAAWQILRSHPGCTVTILEESPFLGGLSRTESHHGNKIDIGGHRFFSKNRLVNEIWQEILPLQGAPARDDILCGYAPELGAGGPDPETMDAVMLSRTRISRIYFRKRFFDYPITLSLKTIASLGVARTFAAGASFLFSAVVKRPEKTLEDFYINRFGRKLYQYFFERYTEKLWGIHPRGIAPDWGAQRVKGLSLAKAVFNFLAKPFRYDSSKVETSLIESFHYPKFGPGQLWEAMAAEIEAMGGKILLSRSVVRVELEQGRIVRIAAAAPGGMETVFPCDCFFSSMPLKDLCADMTPPPPKHAAEIAKNLPYRDFMTAGLLVERLAIRSNMERRTLSGCIPDCWIYIQEPNVKLGRLQIFNNWSPYMAANPEQYVWLGLEYFCAEHDAMWNMPDSDFVRFAAGELRKIGILAAETPVLDSTVIRVKKAYPAYFGSYADFPVLRAFLDTIPNLYCIGRNGQHHYNNMDHSMLTAIAAVNSAFSSERQEKNSVWDVNTEEEYHEES